MPVAVISTFPFPFTTVVPINTETSSEISSLNLFFFTETDSPVSVDSSKNKLTSSITIPSAETLSPASRRTIS